jgi:hypothetical protein
MSELAPQASWWNTASSTENGRDSGILSHCIGDESPRSSVAAFAVKTQVRVAAGALIVFLPRSGLLHAISPFEPAASSDHMAAWKDLCTMRWNTDKGIIWFVWV